MAYTPVTDALLENLIAVRGLKVLTRDSIYPFTVMGGYEEAAFEKGESVKVRRIRKRAAQDVDPRGAGLTTSESTYVRSDITLEKLWGDGFPSYGHDPAQAFEIYVNETGEQCGYGVSTSNDDYMYAQFRRWDASTGIVQIGINSPLAIVANVDATGNFLAFDNQILRYTGAVFDKRDVPDKDRQRYVVMGSIPKSDFLGDAVRITGFASGLQGSGQMIVDGIQQNQFIDAYGFKVGASNVVKGQNAVANMNAGAVQAQLVIASAAINPSFIESDVSSTAVLGAIAFTLTATTALNIAADGVAIGQIAQIRTSAQLPIGHFVVLRIESAGTTAPIVTGLAFSPSGAILTPADIPAAATLRIPSIPSINTAHHREAMAMATRPLRAPTAGSGATSVVVNQPNSPLAMQIMRGIYDILHVSQNQAYYMLTGSKFVDWRMGALLLTR
jgi:hypothetical protein